MLGNRHTLRQPHCPSAACDAQPQIPALPRRHASERPYGRSLEVQVAASLRDEGSAHPRSQIGDVMSRTRSHRRYQHGSQFWKVNSVPSQLLPRSVTAQVVANIASTGASDLAATMPDEPKPQGGHLLDPASEGPSSQPGTDFELLEEVKSCETWQDVLDVVADEASRMSLFTATQAASRILALMRQTPGGVAKNYTQLHAQPAFQTLVMLLGKGVPRMNRAQLCNSLHALAQLRVNLAEPVMKVYALRAQQLTPDFNSRDLSQLLHGWATLKRSPGLATLDLIGFRAKMLLEAGEVEAQSLSMIVHSLAVLDYRNPMLLSSAAAAVAMKMPTLTPQGVANTTWALAKLGHYSYSVLDSATKAYGRAPDQFKPQETCNLLWALAQHRYHPQEVLGLMVRNLVNKTSQLRPSDYATLFYALGTFGVHPGNQLLTELLGPMARHIPRFNAVELCNVYWGLGLIGEAHQPVCYQMAALLPDQFERNNMNEGLLRQAFQAWLCGKLAAALEEEDGKAASRPAISFPPLMMESMKRAWITSVKADLADALGEPGAEPGAADEQDEEERAEVEAGSSSRAGGDRPSKRPSVKQQVAAIIKGLRVPHEAAKVTKDGLVCIDVALKAGEDRFIAMQVVSEHEHTCNTGQLLGPLQFQTQVLEMNGWEVRHVRAKDMKALDGKRKVMFLADLLRAMGVRVAGRQAGAGGSKAQGGSRGAPSGLDMIMEQGNGR